MSFISLLNKQAIIIKQTEESLNEYGELTFSESESASFNCAFQPSSGDFTIEEKGVVIVSTHVLYCETSVDVDEGDFIKVDNQRYNVLFVADDGGRNHHKKVELRKVE